MKYSQHILLRSTALDNLGEVREYVTISVFYLLGLLSLASLLIRVVRNITKDFILSIANKVMNSWLSALSSFTITTYS